MITTMWRMGMHSAVLGLLLTLTALAGNALADISYHYDALGRLIGVVDPLSDSVRYNYDAVGNLLSIERQSSATPWIIGFTPSKGPVGTTVTIGGTGFSTTPGQNTVKFNGVTATVSSATATQLVAQVPIGATTGAVSVTVGGSTSMSATNFTVASDAPTITSFTPAVANPGTTATVTGTNYDTVFANDRVKFNLGPGQVTGATATTVSATVPTTGTSGRLTVTTPYGSAVSTQDFFIPPPTPYTAAADVTVTGRMSVNGPTFPVSTSVANKVGLVVFDATAGQVLRLDCTSVTYQNVTVTVYKPDGSVQLDQTQVGPSGANLSLGTLPVAGTYQISVRPGSWTGSITLALKTLPDIVPTSLTVPTSGVQHANNGTYTFDLAWTVANQGQANTTASWYDRVYLSTDSTWDTGDTEITLEWHTDGLTAGASYSVSKPGVVTPAMTAGSYYVILKAEQSGNVAESNETNNNLAAGPITLLSAPDIVPTALTVPTSAVPRNGNGTYTFDVSWTVQNQGQSGTDRSWYDRVYLSTDSTWDAGDTEITLQWHSDGVAAGASYSVSKPGVVTPVMTAGSYYVILKAEQSGSVDEADETNNHRVAGPITLSP